MAMEDTGGQCPSRIRVVSSKMLLQESKASTSKRCIWVLARLPFSLYPIPAVCPHHGQCSLFIACSSEPFSTRPFLDLSTAFNIDGHLFLDTTFSLLLGLHHTLYSSSLPNHSILITFPLSTSSFMWPPWALFNVLFSALLVPLPR